MDLNVAYRRGFFMRKTGRTNNKYPDELRMRAVRLVTEENVSYREAAKELGIRNKSQVL
ncbi:transposase, partial [Paenibacillus chitinolyticus]|uniref:transposase n=1 Tax=Paenibacillus chitinolyticus TaxID=79263 RepID=UPI0035D9A3DF